jgi:hypothetical protein
LSSVQLSAWLRGIDARELVLIIDACHSEATVNADGFRAGPMGSRGLRQLASDKCMRVLAASRAGESAFERGGSIKHGLLSYVLVRHALEEARADLDSDNEIVTAEWLAYAVTAVPALLAQGIPDGVAGAPARDGFIGQRPVGRRYQQPVLFGFRGTRDPIRLTATPAR